MKCLSVTRLIIKNDDDDDDDDDYVEHSNNKIRLRQCLYVELTNFTLQLCYFNNALLHRLNYLYIWVIRESLFVNAVEDKANNESQRIFSYNASDSRSYRCCERDVWNGRVCPCCLFVGSKWTRFFVAVMLILLTWFIIFSCVTVNLHTNTQNIFLKF